MSPAAAAIDFLRRALDEPLLPGGLRMITIPAPAAPAERLLRLETTGPAVYWAGQGVGAGPVGAVAEPGESAESGAVAGSGAAHRITATGGNRFDVVRAAADRLWPRIRTVTHPECAAPPPRLFGGFAFQPGRSAGAWADFGDASFILPRLLYAADPAAPSLSVIAAEGDMAEPGLGALVAEAERTLNLLSCPSGPTAATGVSARTEDGMEEDAWANAVESIRTLIANGRAEKVVAARRTVLRLERPADVVAVLDRLGRENAAEVRFALRHGEATLLGATPERLVSRRGRAVRTEAIAGSIGTAAGVASGQAAALLASAKDTEEHAFVVDAIDRALRPLCARLDHPASPDIRRLRHVLHLRTPFEGALAEPVHVLDLVERLHPTPAVGGTPTADAMAWIARHEPADRGWYAAPVGWFDARGDGDFVVALRSGLLRGDRAYLYAGAGIVRDSAATAEFAETETKLRTMMDALGMAT